MFHWNHSGTSFGQWCWRRDSTTKRSHHCNRAVSWCELLVTDHSLTNVCSILRHHILVKLFFCSGFVNFCINFLTFVCSFLLQKGIATNFIISRSVERGGIFPKEDVATLCRLAGWSETSGSWALYVKDIFESHLDTSGLIYRCAIYFWLQCTSGPSPNDRVISLQHSRPNMMSPKKTYPGLAATIKRYFKAHHGEKSFQKNPLLPQDVEHMIDVCGPNWNTTTATK